MAARNDEELWYLGQLPPDTETEDSGIVYRADPRGKNLILEVIVVPSVSISSSDTNYGTFICSVGGNTVYTFHTQATDGVADADMNAGDLIRTATSDTAFTSANAAVAKNTPVLCSWISTLTGPASEVSIILRMRPLR